MVILIVLFDHVTYDQSETSKYLPTDKLIDWNLKNTSTEHTRAIS